MQLLQDYVSVLHHAEMELKAHIKDLEKKWKLRIIWKLLSKEGKKTNQDINDKHRSVSFRKHFAKNEIWEFPF